MQTKTTYSVHAVEEITFSKVTVTLSRSNYDNIKKDLDIKDNVATVGENPLPGYKIINQTIKTILYSELEHKFFILDPTTNTIGIYNDANFNQINAIDLEETPTAIN